MNGTMLQEADLREKSVAMCLFVGMASVSQFDGDGDMVCVCVCAVSLPCIRVCVCLCPLVTG